MTKMKRHNKKIKSREGHFHSDSDGQFAFIAGYTEGGAPYGTTWDEILLDARLEALSESEQDEVQPSKDNFHKMGAGYQPMAEIVDGG
jgi:hypothetical protein